MRIVVVSPFMVPPATSGASVRINRLTSWLGEQGHDIHFVWAQTKFYRSVPDSAKKRLKKTWGNATVLEHSGRADTPTSADWGLDDWIDPTHEKPFRWIVRKFKPDIVLVNYIFLSQFLEWVPDGVLRYLDTHDRLSRRTLYERHHLDIGFFHTPEDEELLGCQRADVVFAIQDNERDHFARSGVPVAVVGHPEPAAYGIPPDNEEVSIGFAAAYNKFNSYSLRLLLDELHRTDVLTRHDSSLKIAGTLVKRALASGEIRELPHRVESVGFVRDLDEFYDGLDIVINPTALGTGLKIKTIEAISRGKPLLSTATGSEGLPRRSEYHWCSDIEDLVSKLDELLGRQDDLTGLANASRHLHTEYLINLERNLKNLFSDAAVESSKSPDKLDAFVAYRTGPLAETNADLAVSLRDPSLRRPTKQTTLAHVINPAPARFDSDLYSAQPIAFESMRRARSYARDEGVDVELLSILAGEDVLAHPDGFTDIASRATVVSDVASFANPRPLPLLRDIIHAAAAHATSDYLIYTNADIAVLPHFYTFIAEKVRNGHDALIINRRTIDRNILSTSQLNALYTKVGKKHPGYDCFVFPIDLVSDFRMGDVAVGVHLVGRVLLWNLLAFAKNPLLVDEDHVTFHLGDDNSGKATAFLDYIEHNTDEAIGTLEKLDQKSGLVSRLEGSLADFAPKLLNLDYSPAIVRERDGELDRRLASSPMFVHAHFRTGSTFLWHALRRSQWHRSYYEPLHEALGNVRLESIDDLRKRFTLKVRHDFDGDWLFKEYEELLLRGMRGVPKYRRMFAYESYADNSEQPSLREYIDSLIQAAGTKQAVLQMNRSALRQRWFHHEYPDAHHIYLLRDPREQWASYLSFMEGDARGFSRTDAVICGMNRYRDLVRPLSELVWLHHDFATGRYFERYDAVFDLYTWRERYALFYFLWLQGLLEAAATGSKIVDMNLVSESRYDRMRLENWLAVRGAQVDLSGFRMTAYDHDVLPLTASELEEVESSVQALIVRSFGLSRVRDLARLEAHERLAEALQAAHERFDVDRNENAERERQIRELLSERLKA